MGNPELSEDAIDPDDFLEAVDPDDPEGLRGAEPVDPLDGLEGVPLIEAQYGFTFGGGPVPAGDTVAVVQCVNPTCKHRNQMVEVHDGHAVPVHCGGCFAVLHCVHEFEDRVRFEGTIGSAVEVRETVCRLCGSVDREDRKPILIRVEDLPVAALSALLGG